MDETFLALERIVAERGTFLRREAIAVGYDDRAIARMVRARRWVRIRTGAYALRPTWEAADERERHILTATAVQHASDLKTDARPRPERQRIVLSHATSVVLLGGSTFNLDLSEVHTTREDKRGGRNEAGVRRHRSRLTEDEVRVTRGLRHTPPARAVLETLTIAGLEAAICVGNDFLHRGLATLQEIVAFADKVENWPGSLSKKLLFQLLDERRESVGESRFAVLSFRQGLPMGVPQYEVRVAGQLLGRVDVAYPESGVFVEFDGRVKYTSMLRPGETLDDVVLREKRRQELICAATGWECIRITWADLARPEETARRVRVALERGRIRVAVAGAASATV